MKEPKELSIITDDALNIFTTDDKYIIPLYQRAFAWEYKELLQLIEDVYYFDNSDKYYLGSLIVSRSDDSFEVIDGQQRLTALYLLLSCLGIKVDNTLSFARRERSNYTLEHLTSILKDDNTVESKSIEETIRVGLNTLNKELSKSIYDKNYLIKKLKKVVLYRIEVPSNTDLNRYFEIMNTRGEQLEQHDIIKAKLMGYFAKSEVAEKLLFADIWEACSDMNGYAQMHFRPELRPYLFGGKLDNKPQGNSYQKALEYLRNNSINSTDNPSISDIVKDDFKVDKFIVDKDDVKIRFESIINFPYFLIHCLKIYVKVNGIISSDEKPLIPELMNDKELLGTFNRVLKVGEKDGVPLDERVFAEGFIKYLIKMRYLFDRYFIKREFVNENPEGEWSLKELNVSNDKAYFKNTYFHNYYGRYDGKKVDRIALQTKTIQSALRVSFTSPKTMHWITELLTWLAIEDNYTWHIESLNCIAEDIAKRYVKNGFFDKCTGDKYEFGVDTPHIVFNYLDYLLWRKDQTVDFTFEFRNSVEHWYPRNPSNGTFAKWDDGVDRFGNLCLVTNRVNSKFSNMDPVSKKHTFHDMIEKGSLKLRKMAENTTDAELWKNQYCSDHERAMIDVLKEACGVQ